MFRSEFSPIFLQDGLCGREVAEQAEKALAILKEYEKGEINFTPDFRNALGAETIQFVTFVCLGSVPHKEQLRSDLAKTKFFSSYLKTAKDLFEKFKAQGLKTRFTLFLPDVEPVRTWGWQVNQEEITTACQRMVTKFSPRLPENWNLKLWSEVEFSQEPGRGSYGESLNWVRQNAPEDILNPETEFLRDFGVQFPEILLRGTPESVAKKQLAAYADEGRVLQQYFPQAILLQADTPVNRKDAMFMLLRSRALPIAHPFIR